MPSPAHRYLVCLTGLTAGLGAQGFSDITATAGLGGVPFSSATFGTGVCCGDFDRDGDPDLVIGASFGQPLRYYRNDGSLTFTDRTAQAGLGNAGLVRSITPGDVDNDGDLDLYVCGEGTPGRLLQNNGQGAFVDVTVAAGITMTVANYSAAFGDYDRDGWLDLYLGNRGLLLPNALWHNRGDGTFVDVSASSGCDDRGMTFAAGWIDHDEDGWPDLVVANDKGVQLLPNNLFQNRRDGTFRSVAAALGADRAIDGMGVDFTDAFNDGGVDFFCSDSAPDHLFQPWDPGTGRYLDATATYGMQGGHDGWAVNFLDFDNDGWQDLHVVHEYAANALFRNPGQPAAALAPWPNVAAATGAGAAFRQYAALRADFDADGGVDLLYRFELASPPLLAPASVALLHNGVPRGNWIELDLIGLESNRDGIGARVDVITGALRQRQWLRSGTGYLSGSDLRLHFGIGTATQIDRIEVRWPSGQVQFLTAVAPNRVLDVVEPTFALLTPPRVGAVSNLLLSVPGDQGLPYLAGLAFASSPGIPLGDGRVLPLQPDQLTLFSLTPGNGVWFGGVGALDPLGYAVLTLAVPPLPTLSGLTVFATAATLDPPAFPTLRTVFPEAVRIAIR
ncbi:MAG: CRTAC1 family protein [Planctomycetota bacterium]